MSHHHLSFIGILPISWEHWLGREDAHSKGGVTLHHRHGHEDLDLKEKRDCWSWDRGVVPLGLPFIAQDDVQRGSLSPPMGHQWLGPQG